MPLCHTVDGVGVVGCQIEVIEFGRFQSGINDGIVSAGSFGAEEQVILTRDGAVAQLAAVEANRRMMERVGLLAWEAMIIAS